MITSGTKQLAAQEDRIASLKAQGYGHLSGVAGQGSVVLQLPSRLTVT